MAYLFFFLRTGREWWHIHTADPDTEVGDWIYRVIDVEANGRNTVLCQVLVEVQNR